MKLVYNLIYIYLLLRPYYIFNSGTMQPSDLFLILAFVCLIILNRKNNKILNIVKENKLFLIFTIFTFVINIVYFIMYFKFKFILSSLYYVFNFVAILVFSYCVENKEQFLKKVDKILKFNMVIQLVIFVLSLGRYFGGYRYMGTFNDPNQFGYYILISYCYIYILGIKYKNKKSQYIYLLLSLYLIFTSSSTGMLLGFSVFIFMLMLDFLHNINNIMRKNINKICISLLFLIPIIIATCLYLDINGFDFKNVSYGLKNSKIILRVKEKINKAENKNTGWNLWQERGYDKIYLYPKYILFGAGEGEYQRFEKAAHNNEIHATFPSILFYYGCFPLLIILVWVYKKLKKLPFSILIAYIAIFAESFTLLNQRQVLFWVFIAFAKYFSHDKIKEQVS